jgi:sec-independent protein translocase protein TatA
MGGLSWWHWLIIAAAFILIFGAKKLPDAARGVGRSLRILKSEVAAMEHDTPPATPPAAAGDPITTTTALTAPTPLAQPVPVARQATPAA